MFLPFFSKMIHMTIKPLKISAQIIFMDSQINPNTQNFKIIPYNQEIYKLNMMRYFCDSVYLKDNFIQIPIKKYVVGIH